MRFGVNTLSKEKLGTGSYCNYRVVFIYCRVIYFAFRELEPYAMKAARTVLRGLGGRNAARLPDRGNTSIIADRFDTSRKMLPDWFSLVC